MLPFEYKEHFSGPENLLQVSSGVAVHRTLGDIAPSTVSAWLRWYTLYQETWFLGVVLKTLSTPL
jgi:hypothetical protein